MKIQYYSDLHLEFPDNKEYIKQHPLTVVGEILILAGDIVPFATIDEHDDFFDFVSANFKYTYWVPGNHEYYYYDISKKGISFNKKIRENVFLVNNVSVLIDNVKFLFTTLWSKIEDENKWTIQSRISDFRVIKNRTNILSVRFYNYLHKESIAFLEKELEQNETEKTIVVTHHVPTFSNYPEKYKNSVINQAFSVELESLIKNSNIDYWIYGHHHINISEFEIGKTKLVTNQLGYVKYKETSNFIDGKFLELND